MIIWLTGQPGSGKTTLAKMLYEEGWVSAVIDADEWRSIWPTGFTTEDRYRNVERIQSIALFLSEILKMNVAVACVAPNKAQRDGFKSRCEVLEVYLTYPYKDWRRRPQENYVENYEPPINMDQISAHHEMENILQLNTVDLEEDECYKIITNHLMKLFRSLSVSGTARIPRKDEGTVRIC